MLTDSSATGIDMRYGLQEGVQKKYIRAGSIDRLC